MNDTARLLDEVLSRLDTKAGHLREFRQRYLKTIEFIEAHVRLDERSSVAEVGPGPVLPILCQRFACRGVSYGLLSEGWERQLGQFGIVTTRHDANTQDFSESSHGMFDCILHLEVIEHLNRWPCETLVDTAKLLKPDGKLVLSTVNFARLSNRFRMLIGRSPLINPFVKTPDGKNHIREYTMSEFCDLCHSAGLHVEASEYWQYRIHMLGGRAIRPLCRLLPSLSSHMFFCLRSSVGELEKCATIA